MLLPIHLRAIILFVIYTICLSAIGSCQQLHQAPLFEQLTPEVTAVNFVNQLHEEPGNNILESEFFYNGGGVAVGDINNDELPDVYFTANQGSNALYLNQGDFKFKNITESAGVADSNGWSAGVAMVDINSDNLLDIYVCKAGKLDPEERRNKLYINQGLQAGEERGPKFVEQAAAFKLDDAGYCTQPVFFDYNRDGLLDVFIVNYNTRYFAGFDIQTIREEHDPYAGDRLYQNNGDGTFTDVSKEAGILQNPIGFGLSATVSDINRDGWPDIFVTNDYIERDYLYINQGDGTFVDEITARTTLTSYFSMGSDIADINNNGLPDILSADMLPPDRMRRQVFKTPDYDIYDKLVANSYHYQNMRNMLQLNNGNGTFTEVGQLAGIAATDWSWAALMADFDNDTRKDIFITNGFPRFYTDLDYLNDILWQEFPDEQVPDDPELKYELVQQMSPVTMRNFAFRNQGTLIFEDVTQSWGLQREAVSGAAAYVDLDNDGALDLVVNNINEPPFIYKNRVRSNESSNYLKVQLQGSEGNPFGIGAKVAVTLDDSTALFQEAFQSRGFQTSVEPLLHFGLGSHQQVSIEVVWPDQTTQKITDVKANQRISIRKQDAQKIGQQQVDENNSKAFALLRNDVVGLTRNHQGSFFRDKVMTPLLPHTLDNLGPALVRGDVNKDGLLDLFVGGGQEQAAAIYLQKADGTFARAEVPVFESHKQFDDVSALFFDANGDENPDLYVVSGGNFDLTNGPLYQDRLYLNDGFGNFAYSKEALPSMSTSGSTVAATDIDGDGDTDLFIGGRVLTGRYPMAPRSYLLRNDGGQFRDVTKNAAPDLVNPGMVTDAIWADINQDSQSELIVAGEWMPVRIFEQEADGTFAEVTDDWQMSKTSGWWNALEVADLNGDGYPDLIAGNRGLNTSLQPTTDASVTIYAADFDGNGSVDPIITNREGKEEYPVVSRDLLLRQLPGFKEKFSTYASYAETTIDDLLSDKQQQNAVQLEVDTFASTVFWNNGDGTFNAMPLPAEAQAAPIYDLVVADFYEDGWPDIIGVGNNYGTRPETGPIAGQGILLKGTDDRKFKPLNPAESGFWAAGDIRKIELVATQMGPLVILGRYDDAPTIFGYIKPTN
ncbi:VCBS repeat-containing protein [Fodinibius salsisoli]|uniref:VCBS repeat-containing protein n=1 Tax=Fodinibius salsisoli TaxID=2820877 RepID=A0ABT3PJN6_9BACT|nr:VCBS repeat-containing protein [Fodinibius salsisoli]MCW9706136.1 VCBS repeat-containing protein [Fodinibius salsisoli]